MGFAIAKKVVLTEMECVVCGVDFAIPEGMLSNHRRLGGYHKCPNGHSQGWEKGSEHTRIKELERELAAEQQRKQAALSRENEAIARANKAESKIARQKKRSHAGVCPCCNRTFQQLARHMKTKHPNQ